MNCPEISEEKRGNMARDNQRRESKVWGFSHIPLNNRITIYFTKVNKTNDYKLEARTGMQSFKKYLNLQKNLRIIRSIYGQKLITQQSFHTKTYP